MIKKILHLLCLITVVSQCAAQSSNYVVTPDNLPDPSVNPSFNGKNYNVDLYTGIANVTVPIYSYSVDGLDLGISLSYSTKGIHVDDIASQVGLGWELNAGGYIERQANGIEDEVRVSKSTGFPELDGINVSPNDSSYAHELEYDTYTCRYGGKTVRWVFQRYQPVPYITDPETPLNIEIGGTVTINGNNYGLYDIQDALGNIFEFEKVDYLWKVYNKQPFYPPYKWLLTKITTYSGQVISYKYTDYEVNYNDYEEQVISEGSLGGASWALDSIIDTAHVWHGIISQLTEIDYPNGDVVKFNMNSTQNRCDLNNKYYLDAININSKYDNTVSNSLTYKFNYAYFNSNSSGAAELPITTSCGSSPSNELRLKLKSIDRVGNDNSTTEPYFTFDYNAARLPNRLSPRQDWYGYYNGRTPTPLTVTFTGGSTVSWDSLSIPFHKINDGTATDYGENKSSDISKMQACILTSLTNELGGKTTFNYSGHNLSDEPTSADLYTMPTNLEDSGAYDGLCINTISYDDQYNDDNSSAVYFTFLNGYRFYKGGYFWYPVQYSSDPSSGGTLLRRRYYDHFIVPFDFFRNSNHGYSNVYVDNVGLSSIGTTDLSRTVYYFTNIVDGNGHSRLADDKTHDYYIGFPRSRMSQSEMGLLQKIELYSYYSSILLSKDSLVYDSTTVAITPSTRYLSYYFWGTSKMDTVTISRDYQPFDPTLMRLSKKFSTSYSNGNAFTRQYEYDYNSHNDVKYIKWDDSKNEHYTAENVYSDEIPAHVTSGGKIFPFLNGSYHKVASLKYKHSTSGSDSIISFKAVCPLMQTNGSIVFPAVFQSAYTIPFIYANYWDNPVANDVAGSNFITKLSENTVYDDHNNALETQYLSLSRYTSAIWDTRIGQKLADASNARYTDIAYTSFEGHFIGHDTLDYNKGNWNFYPVYVTIGSSMTGRYYFDLSGGSSDPTRIITSINAPANGKKYIVSFWSRGATPIVALGSTTSTLTQQLQVGDWSLYTTTITGDGSSHVNVSPPWYTVPPGAHCNIDELRLCPTTASMSTYTYEPLFGLSSVSDERNNIAYYQYDVFGQQKAVLDINGNIISLTRKAIQSSDN